MRSLQGVRFLAPHLCVLGRYELKEAEEISAIAIESEIVKILSALELSYEGGRVRTPHENARVNEVFYTDVPASAQWAADGWHSDNTGQETQGVILWASNEPTEFLLPDERIIQPEPFDIVLFHNEKMQHRMPRTIKSFRWFGRWFVKTPDWL